MRPTSPDQTLDRLGIRLGAVMHRNGKAVMTEAEDSGGRALVVKMLTGNDPFWATKLTHEIAVYRRLAAEAIPVTVPDLVHAENGLLVLQRLPGAPLSDQRYPARPITHAQAGQILDAITTLSAWRPITTWPKIFDYGDRIDRYHARGIFDDRDRDALLVLLNRCRDMRCPINHGDAVPGNLLLSGDSCALVDLEYTGRFLPGFDLATLHTLLGASTPHLRVRIDQLVAATGVTEPFLINLAMVCSRELRMHAELPVDAPERDRLALIEGAWAAARERIHHAGGL